MITRLAITMLTLLGTHGLARAYSFSLETYLLSVQVPDGRLLSGSHCSRFWWIGRQCNINLQLCIELYSSSNPTVQANSCSTGWINLGQVSSNSNNAYFTAGTTYGSWQNPTTTMHQGTFQGGAIKFRVTNEGKDVIDYMALSMESQFGYTNENIYHNRPNGEPVVYTFYYLSTCVNPPCSSATTSTQAPPTAAPTSSSAGWTAAAQYLQGSINTNYNPCTNFYQFACGGRNNASTPAGVNGALSTAQYQAFATTAMLLDAINPNSASQPAAVQKAATLYNKCKNASVGQYNVGIMKLIKSLDSWPIINSDWNPSCRLPNCALESYDFMAQIGLMQSHHNIPTLIKAQVMNDWNGSGANILYISPGTLYYGVPEFYTNPTISADTGPSYAAALTYFAEQFAALSNYTNTSNIAGDAQKVFQFEQRLAQFYQLPNFKRRYSDKYNRMTKGQVKARWPNLNWEFYFLHILPLNQLPVVHNLTVWMPAQNTSHFFPTARSWPDNKTVIMEDPDYIDALNALAGASDPRDQQNYIIWRFITSRLYFAGEVHLKHVKQLFGKYIPPSFPEIFEDQKTVTGRELTCAYLVSLSMPYATSRIYGQNATGLFPDLHADHVKSFSRAAFQSIVNSTTWLDSTSRTSALNKLAMSNDLGSYPNQLKNDSFLNSYSMYLDIWANDTFLMAYEKAVQNQQFTMYNQLLIPANSPYTFRLDYAINILSIPQHYSRNEYYLSQGFLQRPFYDKTYPMAVNFGSTGLFYSMAVSDLFDDIGVQFGARGVLNSWLTPQATSGLESRVNCFINQYSQICPHNMPTGQCVRAAAAMTGIIPINAGLRAAYNGYKAYVAQYGNEPRLPGLQQYSMDQIFFLSYLQPYCMFSDPAYSVMQLEALIFAGRVPYGQLSRQPLHNFNKFAQTFGCTQDPDICSVWP